MSNLGSTECHDSVIISTDYQNSSPTQTWLTEVVRTVATTLYAKAADENTENRPSAVHRKVIAAQVARAFGAILDHDASNLSISGAIDILIPLGDLASVGQGYYIPRESRIVRLTRSWGRIAGGLPLSFSEHPVAAVKSPQVATIGRIVELDDDFDVVDRGTEYSEVFTWISKSSEQILSLLNQDLPDNSSRPQDGAVKFYNAGFSRARTRRDRWQVKAARNQFVVAKTNGVPTHYFVCFLKKNLSGWHWFELTTKDKARKWVLLAERWAGSTNVIRAKYIEREVHFSVPDMLPDAWTTALLACGASAFHTDEGWRLVISSDILPLIRILFQSANIELI
jgi:hypothetical protein